MPGKQIKAEILPIIDDYVKCEEIVCKVNVGDLDITGLVHFYNRISPRHLARKAATIHVKVHIEGIDRIIGRGTSRPWVNWLYLWDRKGSDRAAKRLYSCICASIASRMCRGQRFSAPSFGMRQAATMTAMTRKSNPRLHSSLIWSRRVRSRLACRLSSGIGRSETGAVLKS